MGEATKIQWTDHTWNPWRGCQHAIMPNGRPHPGCLNCYAETTAGRNPNVLGEWGAFGTRVMAVKTTFEAPLRWNEKAKAAGERRRVFVDSFSDFFEFWDGPVLDHKGNQLITPGPNTPLSLRALRRWAFQIIDRCDWLDFLILTKRPWRISDEWPKLSEGAPHSITPWFRKNVWLLYSASDQTSLNEGLSNLLGCVHLAAVLGISAEPLVGPIDFNAAGTCDIHRPDGVRSYTRPLMDRDVGEAKRTFGYTVRNGIDWVIVGGESGRDARRCHLEWIESIRDQCADAGVPCFIKQMGSNFWVREPLPHVRGDVTKPRHVGDGFGNYHVDLEDKKGGDPAEWPAGLYVRQFPNTDNVSSWA